MYRACETKAQTLKRIRTLHFPEMVCAKRVNSKCLFLLRFWVARSPRKSRSVTESLLAALPFLNVLTSCLTTAFLLVCQEVADGVTSSGFLVGILAPKEIFRPPPLPTETLLPHHCPIPPPPPRMTHPPCSKKTTRPPPTSDASTFPPEPGREKSKNISETSIDLARPSVPFKVSFWGKQLYVYWESPRNFPSHPYKNDTCAVTPCTAIQGQNKCRFSEEPLGTPLWAIRIPFLTCRGGPPKDDNIKVRLGLARIKVCFSNVEAQLPPGLH